MENGTVLQTKSSGETSSVGLPRKRKSMANIPGGASPEAKESGGAGAGAGLCKDDIYALIVKLGDNISAMNKTLESLKAKVEAL